MAAAFGEFEVEMRIGFGFFTRKTFGSEERIVESIDQKCRHDDAME